MERIGELDASQMTPQLDVLYEQKAVLVLNKPGGLLTQAPPGIDSLEWQVRQYLKEREQKAGKIYLGVPHRLDRPVSGAIVMVRNVRAAQRISAQLQQQAVTKVYWAVVQGAVEKDAGRWKDWMRKVDGEARSEVVAEGEAGAKHASLSYRCLESWADPHDGGCRSLLEIELETGRTHQIRLQAGSRERPILGDELYGSNVPFGPPEDDQRKRWIALHARRLEFRHPMIDERVKVLAPLPEYWQEFSPSKTIVDAVPGASP